MEPPFFGESGDLPELVRPRREKKRRTLTMANLDENSRRTRVKPAFTWLKKHGGSEWPKGFLQLVDGLAVVIEPGQVLPKGLHFEPERRIAPSASRLAWLIRNAERLTPRDG